MVHVFCSLNHRSCSKTVNTFHLSDAIYPTWITGLNMNKVPSDWQLYFCLSPLFCISRKTKQNKTKNPSHMHFTSPSSNKNNVSIETKSKLCLKANINKSLWFRMKVSCQKYSATQHVIIICNCKSRLLIHAKGFISLSCVCFTKVV